MYSISESDNIGFPYIKDGKLYDTNDRVIEKPSILVIENRVVTYGTYGYLKFKGELEGKKLLSRGKSLLEVNIIPLYKHVDLERCSHIIKICILGENGLLTSNEKYRKFIFELCKRSSRRSFNYWVNSVDLAF